MGSAAAAVVALGLLQGATHDDVMTNRRDALLPATVRIRVAVAGAPIDRPRIASGFFCDSKGHVVTNYHVIRGAGAVSVITPDDGREYPVTSFAVLDATHDLAILSPPEGLGQVPSFIEGTLSKAAAGGVRDVVVVSQGDNVTATSIGFSTGTTDVGAALEASYPGKKFPAHAGFPVLKLNHGLTTNGSSGAPVVDLATGKPLGVVVGGLGVTGFFGFGVPWEFVTQAMGRVGATPVTVQELFASPGRFEVLGDPYYVAALRALDQARTRVRKVVLDELNNAPIPGAVVLLTGAAAGCFEPAPASTVCSDVTTYLTTSDAQGESELDVPLGDLDWRVSASHDLYETLKAPTVFSRRSPDADAVLLLKRKAAYARDYNLVFFSPFPAELASGVIEIEPQHWVRAVEWRLDWDPTKAPWLAVSGPLNGWTHEDARLRLTRTQPAPAEAPATRIAFTVKDGERSSQVSLPVFWDRAPGEPVQVSGTVTLPPMVQEVCVAAFRGNKRIGPPIPVQKPSGAFTVSVPRRDFASGPIVIKAIGSRCQTTDEGARVDLAALDTMLRLTLKQRSCKEQPPEW